MAFKFFVYLLFLTWNSWSNADLSSGGLRRLEEQLSCDFENQQCGWIAESVSHYDALIWHLNNKQESKKIDPPSDHSLIATGAGGNYINLNAQYRLRAGSAILSSPLISTSDSRACLSFWYYMHGYDVGHLYVWKHKADGGKEKLFGVTGPQGRRWYKATIPVGAESDFTLKIEGTYSGKNSLDQGSIALDDFEFLEFGPCTQSAQDTPRVDCDFERSLCSWEKIGTWSKDYNFKHSLDKAFAVRDVYVIGGYIREDAFLRGPTISVLSQGACLRFSYYFQNQNGYLAVEKFPFGSKLSGEKEILMSVTRGPLRWTNVYVTVTAGENFYIAFHIRNTLVAIDNIALDYRGSCYSRHLGFKQERSYSCDFESDICHGSQRPLPSFGQWKRIKGPTPTPNTGPEADHTSGDGYYVYMDASTVEKAQMYSPIVNIRSRQACLTFWYFMYGKDVNKLTIWRYKHMEFVEAKRKVILGELRGDKGQSWIQHNVTIPPGDGVGVVLEAARGYFDQGDIAFDDITLDLDGPCPHETPVPVISKPITDPPLTTVGTTTTEATTVPTTAGVQTLVPEIKITGEINPATPGSRVVLECGDIIPGASYEWTFQNDSSRYMDNTAWGHQIVFDEINKDDENAYRCRVLKNGIHSIHSLPVDIKVAPDSRPKPRLNVYGVTNPAAIGSKLIFSCGEEMEGFEYSWSFTGNETTYYSVTKSRFLVLETVNLEHSGSYKCHVTKDGEPSANSNAVIVNVVIGRTCKDHKDCQGQGPTYSGSCVNSRCQCIDKILLVQSGCAERPPVPVLTTIPESPEFDIGETVYLSCKTTDHLLSDSATFEFMKDGTLIYRESGTEMFHIYALKNVGENDSGNYSCRVFYGLISSLKASPPVFIQVTDLVDINCDFDIDTCQWFQPQHEGMGIFQHTAGQFVEVKQTAPGQSQAAILRSAVINSNADNNCLSFLYRMEGPDASSLSVWIYKQPLSGLGVNGNLLWEVVGDHGAEWKQQNIDIDATGMFYVIFRAQGNVAIDNIRFSYHRECA